MLSGEQTRRTSSISCAACNWVCPWRWILGERRGESGSRSEPARRLPPRPPNPAPSSLPLGNWIRPLRKTPLEHAFGDAVLEDFDRAARDHPAAAAPNAIFDQLFLAVAEPAHHLQGLVGDLEPRLVAKYLGDGGLLGRW